MSDYTFFDRTGARPSQKRPLLRMLFTPAKDAPPEADKPMQQMDIELIDETARDALYMHSSVVKLQGDVETYQEYFGDIEPHNAVKLIAKLTHDWLQAYLARELWTHGPRSQVEIVKTAGADQPFTGVDPSQHKYFFRSQVLQRGRQSR